jgi:hypothetical protein
MNIKSEFTRITPQAVQAVITQTSRTNRQSRCVTAAKLLNFAQIVAELKPIFPLSSRITIPEVRCISKPAECETLHVIELEHF